MSWFVITAGAIFAAMVIIVASGDPMELGSTLIKVLMLLAVLLACGAVRLVQINRDEDKYL
jgi:hypothetical protein